jgi:energy-coupling factor transporter ATP-binding protein EcfA2
MKMANPLKCLTITAFRGASEAFELRFEKDQKLTLIYGENGSGKTTICDAFDLLAHEKIGSIEDRGLGTGLAKYWPSTGKKPNELVVKLATSEGDFACSLNGNKIQISGTASRPNIELLRRQKMLLLIEAKPGERYEAIRRFIDITNFETSENALRQLIKPLGQEKTQATSAELENLGMLDGFFKAKPRPEGLGLIEWVQSKLAEGNTDFSADTTAIGKLRGAYNSLQAFPGRVKASLDTIAKIEMAVVQASQAYDSVVSSGKHQTGELLDLLKAGETYLHIHSDTTACPLCGSSEKSKGLFDAVKLRLTQFDDLKLATDALKAQSGALSLASASRKQIDLDYRVALGTFQKAQADCAGRHLILLPETPIPSDVGELEGWLASTAPLATAWQNLEAEWRGEQQFNSALKLAFSQYEANHNKRVALEALIPRVEKALETCEAERKAFTDDIIKAIADDVGKLYEKVHPGEGLDTIALQLDPNQRASLKIEAKFGGNDVPPQAYFSQSHLDTLGLCVFLALALREHPEHIILILDDVLGSIDEPHVERVIEMIYDVGKHFRHVIVTTHYRPWKEKYRWGWLKPDRPCQFVELRRWEPKSGIRAINTLPELALLKNLLAKEPVDIQSACGKAGVILEAVLDYLTQKYECSVPRRARAEYTVSDLFQAIGKLKDHLEIEIRDVPAGPTEAIVTRVSLKPIISELQRIMQARNAFGAHFKIISFELLDDDAMAFAEQVVILMDAITHPDHGWPNNDKSGSYWRNSGDSRRLFPLKKPG